MSSALQNRLVGTIILVALAVIFLPDILDGEKNANRELFVDLPERQPMRAVPEPESFPSDEVKQNAVRQVELVDELPVDEPASEMPTTEQAEATAESQGGSTLASETRIASNTTTLEESAGWVVQLGVFRHEKNVRELLDKLKNAGYRAFSRPIQTRSGELTKVFVGPDLKKEQLEHALPHLNELTNLQGRITPFTVK